MNAFFQQKKWLNKSVDIFRGSFPYLILIATSFFVYIKTICPTIYWRDAPEFANVGYTLGIAHPSGSPVYSLISKIITFLSVGSIAFKINLISLIFAVCTAVILFKTILLLIELCYENSDEKLSQISSLIPALFLVFSQSFWMFAVTAEVYTMNLFFLCGVIFFSLQWVKTGQQRFLFLGTFLYGLSTGVHGGMLIFFPFFVLFFVLVESKQCLIKNVNPQNHEKDQLIPNHPLLPSYSFKQASKSFLLLAFLFLLGFSVFLYLPIRSVSNPTFDWGNPETFLRFVDHITDRKDSGVFFSDVHKIFLMTDNVKFLSNVFIKELTLIGLFCGVMGIYCHIKNHSNTFFLFFLLFSANILFHFTATYESFDLLYPIRILPSIIIFSFWIGLGIYKTLQKLAGFPNGLYFKNTFLSILGGLVLFSFIKDYNDMNKSSYYLREENAKKMYLSMKANSMVFVKNNWFPFLFFQDIESLRKDIKIILINNLQNTSLSNVVSKDRFPGIKFPKSLIKSNYNNKYLYADFNKSLNRLTEIDLLPYNGFLTKVTFGEKGNKKAVVDSYLIALETTILKNINRKDFIFDQDLGARNFYVMSLIDISDYLILRRRFKDAEKLLKIAAYLNHSADKNITGMLAVCYVNQNRLVEAEKLFNELVNHYPDNYWYAYSLGLVSMKLGKLNKAKSFLEKSIFLKQDFMKPFEMLEQINSQLDKSEKYD